MNGSGIPVTGIIPATIPTLTRMWNSNKAATPMQIYMPARSGAVCAFCTMRIIITKYNDNNNNYAYEPLLLGKGREDEVLVRHGQETKPRLRPLRNPFPDHSPGTDGDLGLNDLISCALRVGVGIQKTDQPCLW